VSSTARVVAEPSPRATPTRSAARSRPAVPFLVVGAAADSASQSTGVNALATTPGDRVMTQIFPTHDTRQDGLRDRLDDRNLDGELTSEVIPEREARSLAVRRI